MRLSELQKKDIVDINTGKKIGIIIDASFDSLGNIDKLFVQKSKFFPSVLPLKEEFTITFSEIKKIGEDVILVEIRL